MADAYVGPASKQAHSQQLGREQKYSSRSTVEQSFGMYFVILTVSQVAAFHIFLKLTFRLANDF